MQKRILKVLRHSLIWAIFFALPFIFFWTDNREEAKYILSAPFYWVFCVLFGGLYFFNYYYLVPQFYQQKKYGKFWGILLGLFVAFYFLKPFNGMLRQILLKTGVEYPAISPFRIDPVACILFIILVSLGMALRVIKQGRVTEKRALVAETEKANAELSFLKAQVNPHFLFNTLNNIYSLSVDQRPETSDAIMKLSNIMRYITDEATQDFVPLEHEIVCIGDYIDLQRLRHHENVQVDFSVSGQISEKEIAPLILMTYIENAFKYGISSHQEALITIRIETGDEKIGFFCQNQVFVLPGGRGERTGIGQSNTRQRLKHIYSGKHNLTISEPDGLYTVELVLFT